MTVETTHTPDWIKGFSVIWSPVSTRQSRIVSPARDHGLEEEFEQREKGDRARERKGDWQKVMAISGHQNIKLGLAWLRNSGSNGVGQGAEASYFCSTNNLQPQIQRANNLGIWGRVNEHSWAIFLFLKIAPMACFTYYKSDYFQLNMMPHFKFNPYMPPVESISHSHCLVTESP